MAVELRPYFGEEYAAQQDQPPVCVFVEAIALEKLCQQSTSRLESCFSCPSQELSAAAASAFPIHPSLFDHGLLHSKRVRTHCKSSESPYAWHVAHAKTHVSL